MTIALIFSLGTCIVLIQSVWVKFACTKRLLNPLAESNIDVHNVGLCARCEIFFLKIKQIPFSCRLINRFTFLKKTLNQIKMFLEMSLSWQVMLQQRGMRISLWLCNNSQIHLCLSKMWSLVLCSQSSFYVTKHVETTKTDKTRFFLLEKDELGAQETTIT